MSWTIDREQRSPPAPLSNSSLSCALDNSMKVWQVSFVLEKVPALLLLATFSPPSLLQPSHSGSMVGDCSEKCLGNAMNMTWIDWTKPSIPATKQGNQN